MWDLCWSPVDQRPKSKTTYNDIYKMRVCLGGLRESDLCVETFPCAWRRGYAGPYCHQTIVDLLLAGSNRNIFSTPYLCSICFQGEVARAAKSPRHLKLKKTSPIFVKTNAFGNRHLHFNRWRAQYWEVLNVKFIDQGKHSTRVKL